MSNLDDHLFVEQHEAEKELAGAIMADPNILDTLELDLSIVREETVKSFLSRALEQREDIAKLDIEAQLVKLADIAVEIYPGYGKWLQSLEGMTAQEMADQAVQRINDFSVTRNTLRDVVISKNGDEPDQPPPPPPNFEDELLENQKNISKRFNIHTARDAMKPQPLIDWVVDNLIIAGGLHLFVGKEGSKKTYTLIHLGVCSAEGKSWLDFPTKKVKVLFIDEESGQRRMMRRLHETLQGEFGDENTPFEFISLAQVNLTRADDALLLQDVIEQQGAELVIIDALVDIMSGSDENSVKDVHPVLARLKKIAEETGAAIIVIHHTNKAGTYRGSTAIGGFVDLILMMKSDPESPFITFKVDKAREALPHKFAAEAHWSDGHFWLTATDLIREGKLSAGEEYVLRILEERGPLQLPDIEAMADTCSGRTARNAVYKLAQAGVIYRTNTDEAGRGVAAIYAIREDTDK